MPQTTAYRPTPRNPTATPTAEPATDTTLDDTDDVLEEIDAVLEENALETFRAYVQRGGQ